MGIQSPVVAILTDITIHDNETHDKETELEGGEGKGEETGGVVEDTLQEDVTPAGLLYLIFLLFDWDTKETHLYLFYCVCHS